MSIFTAGRDLSSNLLLTLDLLGHNFAEENVLDICLDLSAKNLPVLFASLYLSINTWSGGNIQEKLKRRMQF